MQRQRSAMPTIDRRELTAIFIGGFLGAVGRIWLERLAPADPGMWPWSTFAANVLGALALGYFATRLQERLPPSARGRPFVGTGFCGALTTFSTMQVEILRMLDDGRLALAAAYASASIAAGLIAVTLTSAAVRRVRTLI